MNKKTIITALLIFVDNVANDFRLCLPRQCNEDEQGGDDSFLVHYL